MWRARFTALTLRVEVVCEHSEVAQTLTGILGCYPVATGEPELRYLIRPDERGLSLFRDGSLLRKHLEPLDAAPVAELELYRTCIARAGPKAVLHAAAVVIDGRAIVLCGPSGAGKTTLTLELVASGARYLSEECVAIDAGGQVWGLARPLHLEPGAVLPGSGFSRHSYPWRDQDGSRVDSQLLHPPADRVASGPIGIGALHLISHSAAAPGAVTGLAAGEALRQLWPEVQNPGADSLGVLQAVLAQCPATALTSATPGRGAQLASGSP